MHSIRSNSKQGILICISAIVVRLLLRSLLERVRLSIMTESEYLSKERLNCGFIYNAITPNCLSISDKHGYEAKIICDSINPWGSRLTTITATYPRFVHSEMTTHREFSRNSASSRAIPVSKVIEQVSLNPAMPYKWQVNIKGMQGGEELPLFDREFAMQEWNKAMASAVNYVSHLQQLGAHKQICNRLLEPFVWMTTVISSTNWENFFHLRCSDLADPSLRHIAEMIRFVIQNNEPQLLEPEEWHLPFVTNSSDANAIFASYSDQYCKKISVARCARVSYLNHEKIFDPEGDLNLAASLETNGHWSAFEHIATPRYYFDRGTGHRHTQNGNFQESWVQYRKTFKNEYVR